MPLVTQVIKAELQEARRGGQQPSVRALPVLAPGAVPPGARRRDQDLRGPAGQAWQGPGLRHLQAGGGVASSRRAGTSSCSRSAHAALQDTQRLLPRPTSRRTARYSVVPRMPGGEVTPDGLIAVGAGREEVRPVHQDHRRPARRPVRRAGATSCRSIWEELIAAGFESGHAYGKSLRTVKSCVGSHLVPLRRAGFASASPSIWRIATRACARRTRSSSRLRLHARVRRSAGQGRRRHRHREGLEPLRLRQRRHEAAPRRPAGVAISIRPR